MGMTNDIMRAGCEEEMEWVLSEIKRRADAGDEEAMAAAPPPAARL